LNYNRSLLFHGGDTGSTPVRDANHTVIELACRDPASPAKPRISPEKTESWDSLTLGEMTLPGFAITGAARVQVDPAPLDV
jgi:hypothetical protein